MNIDTAALVAISKAVTAKTATAANKALDTGVTEIDLTIRIKGTLSKGVPTTRLATANIPTIPALALAMKYAGVTGPAAIKAILLAVSEAAGLDKDAAKVIAERDGISDAIDDLKKQFAKTLPMVAREGVTKAHLGITVVNTDHAEGGE